MPYFCHVGNHLYVAGPVDGCHEPTCLEFKELDVPPLGLMVGSIPGGHNDTYGSAQYKYQSQFDKGLDAYRGAKDEGLQPKATTVGAVEAARKQVVSQKRGLKKLKKMGIGADEVKTVAGVE